MGSRRPALLAPLTVTSPPVLISIILTASNELPRDFLDDGGAERFANAAGMAAGCEETTGDDSYARPAEGMPYTHRAG